MLLSMRLHIGYLLSLEDSDRTRSACRTYLSNWANAFDPFDEDLMAEIQDLAQGFEGSIGRPKLRGKYQWLARVAGDRRAWWAQRSLPRLKSRILYEVDRAYSWFDELPRDSGWPVPKAPVS